MKLFTFIGLLLLGQTAFSQKHDQNWTLGYYGANRILLTFNPNLIIDSITTRMNFVISNGAMSDAQGQLLFYTNGDYVADISGDTMFNGRDLNQSNCSTSYSPHGIPLPQSLLILPSPADSNFYYIFHTTCDIDSSPLGEARKLMYTTIDMTLNGGLGGVVQKNIPIFYDLLTTGLLTSCKHGNGKDWWIFVPQYQTNTYHRILLTSSGIIADTIQYGTTHPGQSHPNRAVFSQDGEWYCRYDVNTGMSLMHFDRCYGIFSDELFKPASFFPNSMLFTGACEFSQSSRFLYITSIMEVNQFDLAAVDILNSQVTVASLDTFNCPFNVNLTWPTLAPDGKIYINSSAGNLCISYIDQPDSPGVACNVIKHGLTFPIAISNLSTFPNNPNYRLGVKDCSTGMTDVEQIAIHLFPNPSSEYFYIEGIALRDIKRINIYSYDGRLVSSINKMAGNKLDVSSLPSGVYVVNIISDRQVFKANAVVIRQ